MEIRKAIKKDFKEIGKILKQEFARPPYKDKWTNQAATNAIKYYYKIKSDIYICVLNNKIVGFLVARYEPRDKGYLTVIEYFAIKEKFQKKGFGKKLLKRLELDAKNKGSKVIYFNTSRNSFATKFYRKQGYSENKKIVQLGRKLK